MPRAPDLADMTPPDVLGAAALTTRAFRGETLDSLAALVARLPDPAGRLHDRALLALLGFQPVASQDLRAQALRRSRLFRVVGAHPGRLRVLAVMLPGDLMANTPLDFIIADQDVRLDLLYHVPGEAWPERVPDHDVAVFAPSDAAPGAWPELQSLFECWPRPAINAPWRVPGLARDALSANLAGIDSICSPLARHVSRAELARGGEMLAGTLVRPMGSHGGQGLVRVETAADVACCLATTESDDFFVTPFVDYRSPDGWFRKYRVAFIEGAAFLCHMAISDHWMIHYLNAGMAEDADKRAAESAAMDGFDTGFAVRHQAALAALHAVIGLDYFSIDCAELADGRLLVFEADSAAIVHLMDPPEVFPYKAPQMRRVFAAFYAMLERRAGR